MWARRQSSGPAAAATARVKPHTSLITLRLITVARTNRATRMLFTAMNTLRMDARETAVMITTMKSARWVTTNQWAMVVTVLRVVEIICRITTIEEAPLDWTCMLEATTMVGLTTMTFLRRTMPPSSSRPRRRRRRQRCPLACLQPSGQMWMRRRMLRINRRAHRQPHTHPWHDPFQLSHHPPPRSSFMLRSRIVISHLPCLRRNRSSNSNSLPTANAAGILWVRHWLIGNHPTNTRTLPVHRRQRCCDKVPSTRWTV